jgi:hypothetical protein
MCKILSTPHGALGTWSASYGGGESLFLSTPHGALGTKILDKISRKVKETFNSTRCIRNALSSLPHPLRVERAFNSTRCIRNFTVDGRIGTGLTDFFQLHTVH